MTSFIAPTIPSADRSPIDGVTSGRGGRVARPIAVLSALVFLVTGCTSGPGSQEDFIDVLTRDDAMSVEEATCISEAVFAEYADDEDALGKISAAPDFAYLESEEGVEGFSDFFDRTVQGCSTVGPTPG